MTDQPAQPPQPPDQPPFDEVAEEVVAASLPPVPAPPGWVSLCNGTGLALVAVAALTFLGIVAQGFAVDQDLSVWYRLGIAFLRNLDYSPIGLMLIVAVALVAVPILAGRGDLGRLERQTTIALGLAAAVALLVALGTVLGVVTRLHLDSPPLGQPINTYARRLLATYVVRNLGPALVAFGATLTVVRLRSPRTVTPAP